MIKSLVSAAFAALADCSFPLRVRLPPFDLGMYSSLESLPASSSSSLSAFAGCSYSLSSPSSPSSPSSSSSLLSASVLRIRFLDDAVALSVASPVMPSPGVNAGDFFSFSFNFSFPFDAAAAAAVVLVFGFGVGFVVVFVVAAEVEAGVAEAADVFFGLGAKNLWWNDEDSVRRRRERGRERGAGGRLREDADGTWRSH